MFFLLNYASTIYQSLVAGSELARMVEKFEDVTSASESQNHYENKPAIQSAFAKDVSSLVDQKRANCLAFMLRILNEP